MRLYLCGPMTGYPNLNRAAFDEAAVGLRKHGFEVVSPAEPPLLQDPQLDWDRAIRASLVGMLGCDAVAVLGSLAQRQRSRGAMIETEIAVMLGMRIHHWNTWIGLKIQETAASKEPTP